MENPYHFAVLKKNWQLRFHLNIENLADYRMEEHPHPLYPDHPLLKTVSEKRDLWKDKFS